MKNLKILLGLFVLSILAIIITGIVLSYLGIEHGPLLIKIGFIFIIVNIVLYLLILIFFVIRNLINLYTEKKQKIIGSKFRTRLVSAFLGLTLIPSILLFILSTQLINNSIDTWFSIEVQKPIYDSMDLASAFYVNERQNVRRYAELIASDRKLLDISDSDTSRKDLRSFLITRPDGTDIIQDAFKGSTNTEVLTTEAGDIIRAVAPLIENGRITGVVVVEKNISHDVVAKLESIRKSYNEYNLVKMQQNPIRIIYFLLLTIATLLIIFLALWISLRIAKGISVPIRSLAEATKTIAHGDLDFRIDIKRDDEIGLLINSFNKIISYKLS